MTPPPKPALEIWSPLPPQASGVADYVHEQLETLARTFDLTLVAQDVAGVDAQIERFGRVIEPHESRGEALRLYHVGNSPLHGFIYREALRTPGVVFLHEWNLHELLLGFAVADRNFDDYRQTMRREHGERGAIAAETIASALGGRHWTSVFPLNADLLGRALGVVCLSRSTAARVSARIPGTPLLRLDHHAFLTSKAANREEARARLEFGKDVRIVLAPGLGTESKSLEVARAAMEAVRREVKNAVLVTVGGGSTHASDRTREGEKDLGRVSLPTLGDALLAADVVLALRFPGRGETSGVLMRALAAGRAVVASSGSTADEDLPQGVVARVKPGVSETRELAAVLCFLLNDEEARRRLEALSGVVAKDLLVGPLTHHLADFLRDIASYRGDLESKLRERGDRGSAVRPRILDDVTAAASSLGLTYLPSNVFERLTGL